jgi:hypothetical protein
MAGKLTKWPLNVPASSIARPSKIYPNWYFWFKNIPSGNPESAFKHFHLNFLSFPAHLVI